MHMTGQQSDTLTAKLQARQREQLDAVAALTQSELQRLANSLKQQCESAASTTSADMQRLSEAITSTADRLQTIMRQARNTAEAAQLTTLEQSQLKQALHDQLQQIHAEAIGGQIKPLQRELTALNREAQALSKTTAKAWLKPLAIGASVAIGVILAALAGTLTLDKVIGSRAATLSELQSQISAQRMTLTRLQGSTWGIDLQVIEGQQYIVLPQNRTTDGRRWNVGDRIAIKVE